MINGNDGGASVTFNGGESWSNIYNQPTGEFYHITTDTRFPYRVLGTQQDNSAVSAPSRSNRGAIQWWECYNVGSSESGHIAVRPDNPNIVYAGAYGSNRGAGPVTLLYDHSSGEVRGISAWPDAMSFLFEERKYRFAWDNPLVISPHDSGVLYGAAKRSLPFRGRRLELGGDQPGPDAQRAGGAGRLRPADRHRDLRAVHDFEIRRVAGDAWGILGRLRRRPHSPFDGRRGRRGRT